MGEKAKPFVKGDPRAGRPKGTPNRTTATLKLAILEVFERRGGISAMLKWANKNPTEFYKICARLIPQELTANVNHNGMPQNRVVVYIPANGRDELSLLQPRLESDAAIAN